MTDKLMEQIKEIEQEISAKRALLIQIKNEWLIQHGWEIKHVKEGFISFYSYQKGDHFFICEDEAIDQEANG